MRKLLKSQSGYAFMVILVLILVMALLLPVMLTAATYGMKNTISTNHHITAQYLADTAYQETVNRLNIEKTTATLQKEKDIEDFIDDNIIQSKVPLNGGTYSTIYHPSRPKEMVNSGDDLKYTYYFRSIGMVDNQTANVDYSVSFTLEKISGTTILYEMTNKRSTYDRLPTSPDNLKAIAVGETYLNNKVNNDITNKLNGSSSPNIAFKNSLTPVPLFYKNELNSSDTINKSVRVSKVNLNNNLSLTVNGDLYVENDINLGNNVSLTVNGNLFIGTNFSIYNNAILKVTGDVIVKNSIYFHNNIFFDIGGNMFVQGGLTIENNAPNSRIGKSLYILNNLDIGNNGQVNVANDIVANNIKLTNNNHLTTGGEVLVKNEFEAANNANIELAGGLEVGIQLKLSNNIEFKFAGKLYITNVLELGNNAKMLLLKTGGPGNSPSYRVVIDEPKKI